MMLVSMRLVYMMLVSMMLVSMMHVSKMLVSIIRIHDGCIHDAYISDAFITILVSMMHVFMMHVCMMHICTLHVSMILDALPRCKYPWSLTLMHVSMMRQILLRTDEQGDSRSWMYTFGNRRFWISSSILGPPAKPNQLPVHSLSRQQNNVFTNTELLDPLDF